MLRFAFVLALLVGACASNQPGSGEPTGPTSCTVSADCVMVETGDPKTHCPCGMQPMNEISSIQYKSDREKQASAPADDAGATCVCGPAPQVACVGGTCVAR